MHGTYSLCLNVSVDFRFTFLTRGFLLLAPTMFEIPRPAANIVRFAVEVKV